VASVVSLGSVPGRAQFISYASGADTEDAALLFQQMAELIANFNAMVEPVRSLSTVLNLPITTTVKGSAVLLLPIDRLLWTERTDGLVRGLGKSQPNLAIWIAGDSSPRAEAGLKRARITFVQRCGGQLLLLD
jgi:hypothetical protein